MTDEEIKKYVAEAASAAAKEAAASAVKEALEGVTDFLGRFEDAIRERFGKLEARFDHLEEKMMEEFEAHHDEYRRLDGRLYRVEKAVVENHEPRITALEARAQ